MDGINSLARMLHEGGLVNFRFNHIKAEVWGFSSALQVVHTNLNVLMCHVLMVRAGASGRFRVFLRASVVPSAVEIRRGGRAVECTGLENQRGLIALRGFESHPLRHAT